MTTTTMMRQLRILEIIIICYLAKTLEGKSFKTQTDQVNDQQNERSKRGFSHYGGNDFGSSTHVSSAVLQYGGGDDHIATLDSSSHLDSSALSAAHSGGGLDSSSHFDISSLSSDHGGSLDALSHLDSSASNGNSWSASGHSLGEEVWLEPLPDYHGSSAIESTGIHTSSIASTHPGSDHIANAVFSDDSANTAHFEIPSSPQLHTQISSSSSIGSSSADIGSASIHDHGAAAISDNIDFNNVADLKSKHYAKSYGK